MTELSMRRATPADKEAVVALCRAIEPNDYVPEMYDEAMTWEPPNGFYVAEVDGRIVGCHSVDAMEPDNAFLYAMRIDPQVQGQGFGSAFCRAQIADALGWGAQDIFLSSAPTNIRAHKTVERNGFVNRGPWFMYESVAAPAVALTTGRARPATAADVPLIAAFQERLAQEALNDVLPAPDYPYGFHRSTAWPVADLVVVEGEAGLEGAMLCCKGHTGDLYLRRLEGSPEAAADLLGYAVAWGRVQGMEKWTISLPTRCEHLLAPLDLDPQVTERWFIFHYRAQ